MAFFAHIIALDANSVRFQMRGLEFRDVTLCHHGELSVLSEANSWSRDEPICWWDELPNEIWRRRAASIHLPQYDVSRIDLDRALTGLTANDLVPWIVLSVACRISEFDLTELVVPEDAPTLAMDAALDEFGVDAKRAEIAALAAALAGALAPTGICVDSTKIWQVFTGQMPANLSSAFHWVFDHDAIRDGVFVPLARAVITDLLLVGMGLSVELNAPHDELVAYFQSVTEDYFAAEITSGAFAEAFSRGTQNLLTIVWADRRCCLLSFRNAMAEWGVFNVEKEYVRAHWAAEAQSQVFYSEASSERHTIQGNRQFLHNMIAQSCDRPVGYPALVTPIMTSYSFLPHRPNDWAQFHIQIEAELDE
jgi:hypothetical protein